MTDLQSVNPLPLAPAVTNGSAKTTHRGSIQSVDRALSLLEALAEAGGEASLTSLSRRTALNVSTCHHLLSTLVNRGYVAKVPGRRSYALGTRMFYLGHACMRQVDLPQRAEAHLDRIGALTGETVYLAVLHGDSIVNLVKPEARQARLDHDMIGRSDAPHASATGKAVLAWLPEDRVRHMLGAAPLLRFTDRTLVDFDLLAEELRQVRRNGFAVDREELQAGVVAIAAAIRDQAGAVLGAIGVAAPASRTGDEPLARMREAVVAAAKALSAELADPGLQQRHNGSMS